MSNIYQKLAEIKKKLGLSKYNKITTVIDDEDILDEGFEIMKKRIALSLRRYPKTAIYNALIDGELWEKYKGLTKEQSDKINKILIDAILEGKYLYPDKVAKQISREVGIDESRAMLIARTELAYMANKARGYAYRELTKVQKFKWVAEPDACEKCKEVERRTANGVTLDELKKIIKEVGGKSARELLVHPNCRCALVRYYDDERYMRWWE